jgi:GAF domain-containing protein
VFDERKRQSALEVLKVLSDAQQSEYDDITKLVSLICGVPISAVSLLDNDRQWFKSKVGLGVSETPRDWAFCDYAIRDTVPFVVTDASKDERFIDNPLVTGEPHIRFYAGAPIIVSGQPLGTLCVIDNVPRTLSDNQLNALETLRNSVARLIENARAVEVLTQLQEIVPLCAWCNDSVRLENAADSEWITLTRYIHEKGNVSHGICEDCSASLKAETLQ